MPYINQKSSLSPEANVEPSPDKPGSSDRKELPTPSGPRPASSFTKGPAAMQPTSLEQVQATLNRSINCTPGMLL